MALDAKKIEAAVKEWSSLTQLFIGLSIDVVKGLKLLWKNFRPELSEADQDVIIHALMADAGVRKALARMNATKDGERGPVPEADV